MAIRSGRPVVVRDTKTLDAPWHQLALQHGYASSIALPVRENDEIIGVLHIYAAEPDAFDDNEVKLLNETAADLSYGITSLRLHMHSSVLEGSLRASERRFLAAAEASMDALLILISLRDYAGAIVDFRITEFNTAAETMFNLKRAKDIGQKLSVALPFDITSVHLEKYANVVTTGTPFEEEFAIDVPSVDVKWLKQQVVRMDGGIAISLRNITQAKKSQERLNYLAYFDDLTGLPNRALFSDRISQAIADAHRHNRLVGLMFMDIDHFKNINDTFGHIAGDSLLQAVGERLKAFFREDDTVARFGGDEFAVVLADMSNVDDMTLVVQKILHLFKESLTIFGNEMFVTFSIGITIYPFDDSDIQNLLQNADAAMYQAKALGRNNYQFYSAEMTVHAKKRMELEIGLRNALKQEQFVLYYQPQLDLKSGKIIGMEALIRWQHPEKGMISPADFIPVAEDTGLIVPIGAWVLRTACVQAKAWQDQGLPNLLIAVNLSSRQFKQGQLLQEVMAVLDETGLDPHFLELEMTESLLMDGSNSDVLSTLNEFKKLGITLAIDDFGTGYSSLSYLKRFPIDKLKIDQSFVCDVISDPEDASLVKAIIAIARSLKLKVIAEGVETEDQLNFMRRHDCDQMQGYYFSQPLPADEFAELVRSGISLPLTKN
jgi:diguanylate cyclase (GGDEF)-like protein